MSQQNKRRVSPFALLIGVGVLAIVILLFVFLVLPNLFGGGQQTAEEPPAQEQPAGETEGEAAEGEDGERGGLDDATEGGDGTGDAAEGTGDGTGDAAEGTGDGTGDATEGTGDGTGDAAEGTGDGTGDAAEGTGEQGPPAEGGEGTGGEEAAPTPGEQQPTQAPTSDDGSTTDPAAANPAIVPANTPLESNGWLYDFNRPGFATFVVGSLGDVQPQGRFVVVLTFVVNRTGQPQSIPADFFVLKDAQGRVYNTVPEASSAYINQYGRGFAADLSQEEQIPPDGLTRSVPLVFDVSPDATDMIFFARSNPDQGWLVLQDVQVR
jgi:hypothetical protein